MTQAKLATRALDLKRRIYASLPFRYRIAKLLFHLKIADDFIKRNLGTALYTEFIRAGVEGLPDVRGVGPALNLREKVLKLKNRAANLPVLKGYGASFGGQLWMVASKYLNTRDSEAIADVLQNVVAEVYSRNEHGKDSKLKSVSLSSAESYIKWLVGKRAQDWLKKPEHSRQFSLTDPETGGMPDIIDSRSLKGILNMIDRGDLPSFKREIDDIDPGSDRPWAYIEAIREGLSPSDIAREWGVNRSVPSTLLKRWLPELKRIFEKYLTPKELARAM